MPYFVYRVKPFAQLEKLAAFTDFPAASAHAKALRARLTEADVRIRVMFAEHEQQAEDLLCELREARPAGDD
jgi:hypothetical protein